VNASRIARKLSGGFRGPITGLEQWSRGCRTHQGVGGEEAEGRGGRRDICNNEGVREKRIFRGARKVHAPGSFLRIGEG